MLVDNEFDIRSSRLLVLEAAAKADRGEEFRTEAAVAKVAATEAAGRVVDRAIQIHGGLGVSKELPLERWYREMRIRRIGEGPTERSEEHTSELQSLMRISYAVFCLK